MTTETEMLGKKEDMFLSFILFLVVSAACLTGNNKVFLTAAEVIAYEAIFITTYLIIRFRNFRSISFKAPKSVILAILAYILIMAFHTISAWLNETPSTLQVLRSLTIVTNIVFIIFSAHYLQGSTYGKDSIIYGILISVTLIALTFFIYALLKPSDNRLFSETFPFAANIRHLGYLSVIASLIAFNKLHSNTDSMKNCIFMTLLFTVNLAFTIWLGSRTGLATTILITLTLTVIFKKVLHTRLIKLSVISLLASFLLANALSTYSWNGPNRFKAQQITGSLSSEQALQSEAQNFSSGRTEMWYKTLVKANQSPLLGHGPESYYLKVSDPDIIFLHPHNSMLQIYLEGGLVSLISVLVLIIHLALRIRNNLKQSQRSYFKASLLSASLIAALLIMSLTSGALYFSQPLFILTLAIAIQLSLGRSKTEQGQLN